MNGLYDEIRLAVYGVWNRRWIAIAIAWAICLVGWLAVSFIPNSYEAKARIFVQSQDLLSDTIESRPTDPRRDTDRLEKTLTSSINLEKVVRSTALGRDATSDAAVASKVSMLQQAIKVEAKKDNLFEVTAKLTSGQFGDADTAVLTANVVQKLIELFQEENVATDRRETSQTLRFLDAQLEERGKALKEAELKRVDFESRNVGLLPGMNSAGMRSQSARAELTQIESQLAQARSSLAALNGQIAGTPQTITTRIPGAGNPAQAALNQARAELSGMKANGWKDSHPDVIAKKNQIASLQAQAASGGGSSGSSYNSPNPAYAPLVSMRNERQATVAALEARKAALQGEMGDLSSKLAAEPAAQAELDRITRDYDVLKQEYDKLLAQRQQVALRGDVSTETDMAMQFRVIDPPTVPRKPAAPARPLLIIGVLIVGVGGGVAAAFGLSQLQSSFASAPKLEKATGLPVLGSVSQMFTRTQQAQQKRWSTLFYSAAGGLVAVFSLLIAIQFVQTGSLV